MKKLSIYTTGLLVILFVFAGAVSATDENITEVTGLDFAVAEEDELNGYSYTWKEAMEVCENRGMVLPSIEELGQMYCNAGLRVRKDHSFPQTDPGCENGISKEIKNLNKGFYWSSTKGRKGLARHQVFSDGFQDWSRRSDTNQVRCIARY
ncbi:MAG: hypothetical protein KAQ98_03610 [Bacteriovoracaceae bacterium]|nr:hypothetical protein [Bacteriovoracaceae bacterium]